MLHEIDLRKQGPVLTERDKAAFDADGAVLLRGMIADAHYAEIEADLLDRIAIIERRHGLPVDGDLQARLLRIYAAVPESQSAIYDAMPLSPSIARFAGLEAVQGVARQLVSPVVSVHHRRLLLMSPPENEWHLPVWHQDWFYNEGPVSTMTLYAPLQRTTSFNGGLKIALGEWRNGLLQHGEHDHGVKTKWHNIDPAATDRFERVAEPELERGDVIVFNSLVPHSAQVNRSSAVRMVVNLRFMDLTDSEFTSAWWRTGPIGVAREALARKA